MRSGLRTPLSVVAACLALFSGCDRSSRSVAPLRLNEVMAKNTRTVADPNGLHLDWVEIYNPAREAVSLQGYSLSDNPARPLKHRFPAGFDVPAMGYRIVWLVGNNDLPAPAAGAAVSEVRLGGLHADFGLSSRSDSLLLFARDGRQLIDRIEIRNLPSDVTVGRYPDGGDGFGPMWVPTPGGPNVLAGVKPIRWRPGEEPARRSVLASGEVVYGFTLVQDRFAGEEELPLPDVAVRYRLLDGACDLGVDGRGFVDLEVLLTESAELEENADCVDPAPSSTSSPAALPLVDPDDGCRRGVDGRVISPVPVRSLGYQALLPALPCGTRILVEVLVDDGIAPIPPARSCLTYCAEPPTLVINEYQPRNRTTLRFRRTTSQGTVVENTPDWLEIFNYGPEPIDLRGYALTGRRDFALDETDLFRWVFGRDTRVDGEVDPRSAEIGPGEYRIVLADQDGGDVRRVYRLVEDATGSLGPEALERAYFSTRFALNPSRKTPDETLLVSPDGVIVDRAVLDFAEYAREKRLDPEHPDFLADASVARFPDPDPPAGTDPRDLYPPGELRPGTVTDCPTPEAPNQAVCDVAPVFSELATAYPRRPAAGEPVRLDARVSVDRDSQEAFRVELLWLVDGREQAAIRLTPGDGVARASDADQVQAAAGATLWEIRARFPGQPDGALVEFRLRAIDDALGLEAELGPETAPIGPSGTPRLSFRYRSGAASEGIRPRITEVLPQGVETDLPGLPPEFSSDFAEILWPAEAEAPVDLGGYFLTQEDLPEGESSPIRYPRQWAFPPGTVLEPGERLVLLFTTPPVQVPGYLHVSGFDLDRCRETLYLISPDEEGNGVIDGLSWDLADCAARTDVSVGESCGGGPVVLTAPTPGASNGLPPILYSVSHDDSITGEPGACLAPGSLVRIQGLVLLDRALLNEGSVRELGPAGAAEAAVGEARIEFDDDTAMDLGGSLDSRRPPVGFPGDFLGEIPATCPERVGIGAESCYELAVSFRKIVVVPDRPVVRYRLHLIDACGGALDPCGGEFCFGFGTSLQERSPVVINEIVRAAPLPGGDGSARSWIELYSPSGSEVDVGGYLLSDVPERPDRAVIPEGTAIAAGGYLLVVTDGKGRLEGADAPLHVALDFPWARPGADCVSEGELFLRDRPENGTCLLSSFRFSFPLGERSCDATSLGRRPDGSGAIEVLAEPTPGAPNGAVEEASFVRGDATGDGRVNITDAVHILAHLFAGGGARACLDAFDADDTGALNVTDAIYLLEYLFGSGPIPPPPFPSAGNDPTGDELPCPVPGS